MVQGRCPLKEVTGYQQRNFILNLPYPISTTLKLRGKAKQVNTGNNLPVSPWKTAQQTPPPPNQITTRWHFKRKAMKTRHAERVWCERGTTRQEQSHDLWRHTSGGCKNTQSLRTTKQSPNKACSHGTIANAIFHRKIWVVWNSMLSVHFLWFRQQH